MSLKNDIQDISILELERQFANDLSSSMFVVLAQKYFDTRDYKRAMVVCQIGLKSHPSNIIGKLIMAKTCLCLNQLVKAEKVLFEILLFNPNAINPLKLLVEVQLKLGRDKKKIKNNVDKLLFLLPNNKYYANLINVKDKPVKKVKRIKTDNDLAYDIDDSMATFAFYDVVKSQKQYQLAYNILLCIEKKTGNSPKINEEKRVMTSLLETII